MEEKEGWRRRRDEGEGGIEEKEGWIEEEGWRRRRDGGEKKEMEER